MEIKKTGMKKLPLKSWCVKLTPFDYNAVTENINTRTHEYYDQLAMKFQDILNYYIINILCYNSKTFYIGKKIPLITLLLVNSCLISDFKVKQTFLTFLALQCIP